MDPAYTEIYTYGHTLSLHDALPISFVVAILSLARTEIATGNSSASAPMLFMKIETTAPVAHRNRTMAVRSEAHTSELQSLMRSSYAVFCLKKTPIAIAHMHARHTITAPTEPTSPTPESHTSL